jgi:hypothetical protein
MLTFQSAAGSGSVSSSAAQVVAQKQKATPKPGLGGSMSSSAAQPAAAAPKKASAAKSNVGGNTKASTKLIATCGISSKLDMISHLLTLCPQFAPMQRSSPSTTSQKKVAQSEDVFASCQHSNKEAYAMLDDKSYFSKKYLENTPQWPSTCAKEGCSRAFGHDYKVGISHPVYCCSNAKNKHHPCMHAYCKDCFEEWQTAAGNTPRKRRRPTRQEDF